MSVIIRMTPRHLGEYIAIESEALYIELAKIGIFPKYMDNKHYYYSTSKQLEEIIKDVRSSKVLD